HKDLILLAQSLEPVNKFNKLDEILTENKLDKEDELIEKDKQSNYETDDNELIEVFQECEDDKDIIDNAIEES
ncbi:23801_t:CDS:1, partial [Racocetra persica]